MLNQKCTDRIVRSQKILHQRISKFEIKFEGNVRVDRSQMRREGIPSRRGSMLKTTRGKCNVDKRRWTLDIFHRRKPRF